jgi:hypothetical protein
MAVTAAAARPLPDGRLSRPVSARRLLAIPCAVLVAFGLGACGHRSGHPLTADANNDGDYVDAGPITYQLQVSRELNPYSIEDRNYLLGVSSTTLPATQEWYAVFLWARNQTGTPATTSDSFDIVDTQGNHYYPVAINPALNPYAWTTQTLAPSATEPAPGTPAFYGPTQGRELLFRISDSAYDNRPLTLEIHVAGQAQPSTISLDL